MTARMRSPSHGEPARRQLSSRISRSVAFSRSVPWAAALTSCSYGLFPASVEIFPFFSPSWFWPGFYHTNEEANSIICIFMCMYMWFVLYLYRQCNSERTSPSNPHTLGRDHRQWGNLALGSDGNKTKNMYSNETLHSVALHDVVFSLCDIVPVAKGFCTPHKSLTIRHLWWMNWELSMHRINPYGIWTCLWIFRHSFLHMQWTQDGSFLSNMYL